MGLLEKVTGKKTASKPARVTDIRFIGYGVKDLSAEKDFYKNVWKLVEVPSDDAMTYLAAEGSKCDYSVRLRPANEDRIDLMGWSANDRNAVERLAEQVVAAGGKIISPPSALNTRGGGYGFRFFDTIGFTHEVACDFEQREPRKLAPGEPVPEKISHFVLHAPDHKKYVEFFEHALGFKLSDWLGDFMAFLRCNEWHHRLAILPRPPCFNHVAYDVPGVDAVMKGVSRLKEHEHAIKWGPGRHTAGNNIFSYFTTPTGWAVEYTSDLEMVDDENWVATVHTPSKDTMDQWGIGVGGPETMPKPVPDPCLFKAPEA
jgi:predicted enzyme related to lactoylglutathione lyase